ncbi:hypothetical protein AMTRI_Chr09g20760 [Amborella trichopoda]|uniref:Uncharacterized protein n=1 Tax=Amborella trichopoda TaxID=13333 RepID=U5CV54_AMBTC|nr:uncharacterized protein LOC18425883 [Amborella trichopoda]ERM97893.1 hypothetical protein AMTR_s02918p00001350 [Amborella trichopoda]|eukprot:XP_006830477.1 uncharacterized protein LOC18425883 [Amborella trichopoda]
MATTHNSSFLTLSPLPYPVLFIVSLALLFLGFSSWLSFEAVYESAVEQASLALALCPILLLLAVRWLSSLENHGQGIFFSSDRRQTYRSAQQSEGSSPWGVMAFIVLLLVMLSYQSTFLEKWFP